MTTCRHVDGLVYQILIFSHAGLRVSASIVAQKLRLNYVCLQRQSPEVKLKVKDARCVSLFSTESELN